MNDVMTPADPGLMKFAVGQPVPRTEDPKLVSGRGRYSDDINMPGQAYAVMLRSSYGHGIINSIDTAAALAVPGVLAVYTAADFKAAGYGDMPRGMAAPNRDGSPMLRPGRGALASGKVRYVGDPIAVVVAESKFAARDGAEAIFVDIEPLPAVTSARDAVKPGAPQLWDDVPNNTPLNFGYGDTEKVAAAFAAAAHVVKMELPSNRVVVAPMEPRAAIGQYDPETERWTLNVGSQGAFGLRALMAGEVLKVPPKQVRILTGNVGGSFGMKASAYPEYLCVLHAAKMLGRPVKWTDDRSESFVSDSQGRDHEMTAELALDRNGKFLAVRVTGYGNLGAQLSNATIIPATGNVVKNVVSVYDIPLLEVDTKCVFTNTVPVGAYRGAGRPEGNYYMERLIDQAALETGIDKITLRKRNFVKPEQIPYKASSGMNYDSGDFGAILDDALKAADWDGFATRQKESAAKGLLRGRGIGSFLEVTAPAGKEMGGIRFEPDGTVTIITGTLDYGQGHATPFAQVLSAQLGVPFEKIRLLQGDSDELLTGGGTGGSRSIMASGGAIVEASHMVIENGRKIAAQALEAAAADIEFSGGRFEIVGTDRGIGIMELAAQLREGRIVLPEGVPATLDVSHVHETCPSAFPNGCHIAEVEVDPETGVVTVARYATVNDFGNLINPMLVAGQAHGGIVQGIGQALMEHAVWDEEGQFLTGSFQDYCLPRATDIPDIGFISHPVPARTNALGAKGCGEAGCAGSLPAVMNALNDALQQVGVKHIDMPATPLAVWQAIQDAKVAQAA